MSKRKKYGLWTEDDMAKAISAFRNGDMGLNAVCKMYGIPKPTLKRHIENKNAFANEAKQHFGRSTDLPPEVEKELVEHILQLESCMFGLTSKDLRRLAFEIAEKNEIPHHFNSDIGMAGKKWYYQFMKRNPNLSLRSPEPTSIARATGFCKERVKSFFNVLTEIVDKNNLSADSIYNVDETGISTVQKPMKVVALKGKHQVGSITSGERGVNTTAVCCMNAAGSFVPPMLIFKRQRFKNELKDGAPPLTIFGCSENGWITTDLFSSWVKNFINYLHLKPIAKEPGQKKILLILDGHSTHTKNLEALTLARDHGIIMLSLPAHTTHRLQPLDRSFFKSLNSKYNTACDKWMRTHPGRCITQFQVSLLFGEAYPKAACMDIAMNGFRDTGIWPVDDSIFRDEDFAPSEVLRGNIAEENVTAFQEEAVPCTSGAACGSNNQEQENSQVLTEEP